VSVSAVVEVLLQEALRAQLEHEHGALIEAVVERTIRTALTPVLIALATWLCERCCIATRGGAAFAALVSEVGADRARSHRREAHSAAWRD
jgi:hypothetical protein